MNEEIINFIKECVIEALSKEEIQEVENDLLKFLNSKYTDVPIGRIAALAILMRAHSDQMLLRVIEGAKEEGVL